MFLVCLLLVFLTFLLRHRDMFLLSYMILIARFQFLYRRLRFIIIVIRLSVLLPLVLVVYFSSYPYVIIPSNMSYECFVLQCSARPLLFLRCRVSVSVFARRRPRRVPVVPRAASASFCFSICMSACVFSWARCRICFPAFASPRLYRRVGEAVVTRAIARAFARA